MKNGAKIALTCSFLSGSAIAATGAISASPNHLTLPAGSSGTATVTWSTSGASTAQVYVGDGQGTEQLFAQGPSGSQGAPWIQPNGTGTSVGYYVFTLYEGTTHSLLLGWTSVNTQAPPASTFGFNYWPAQHLSDALLPSNWPALRAAASSDLDQISSLGGGIVRLLIYPQYSGWVLPVRACINQEERSRRILLPLNPTSSSW